MKKQTFLLTATLPDGRKQTLLKIDDWDFNWQEECEYKNRIRLPKGTRLDAAISYDNSEGNRNNPSKPPKVVKWGPMTTDEMAATANTKATNKMRNDARRVGRGYYS